MRKLKSIDAIYDEVKDCCFVLTNDAPLATALNKLVDKPLIGPFAMTPRQVATASSVDVMGSPVWGELKVITTICKENPELDLRYVHGEVQKIKEIRQYTKDVGKHLFTPSSKKVYDSWKAIPTVEAVMDRFDGEKVFYPRLHGKVAVVGIDMFNDLDKCMIPHHLDYLDVDIFESGECYIPEIYQIGNDRQLAENAIALIDGKDPNDFAIVMNTSSPIVDAVKTALYRRSIPFINSLMVRDLNQVRDYLQFLQLSLSYETLRVKHVREMFSSLNAHIKSDMDEHLLDKVVLTDKADELRQVMKDIRSRTFDEVRQIVCGPKATVAVKIVIEDLEINDKKVCTRLVERMNYSVDNIADLHHNEQIPENEKMGVLLADSRNSVFIDRPIVIYLGMGEDWDLDLADKKYVDHVEDEMERMAAKLEALVQQGVGRYYLVNTSRAGKPARPSVLFSEFFPMKPEKENLEFDDLLEPGKDTRKERWSDVGPLAAHDELDCRLRMKPYDKPFSQSGFKAYYECPYSFQFQSTLGSKDADYFEFGNLIHSFAELYFSHPEIVEERFDELVEIASARFSGISSPALGELDSEKIRCGMTNVRRYIDQIGFAGDRMMIPLPEKFDNFFYDALGLTETSSLCEEDLFSEMHRVHGKMDLNAGIVIDYKTAKAAKSASEIRKAMMMEGDRTGSDFQALFYLAIANEKWSGREMQFFFAMGNDSRYLEDGFDVKANVRKVLVYDPAVDTYSIDGYICEAFRKANRSNCAKDPKRFMDLMRRCARGPRSEWSSDPDIIYAAMEEFGYKNEDKNRETVSKAIQAYVDVYESGIFIDDNTVVILKEKMDSILKRIDELHAKMMQESISELPAEHDKDCSKCDYFRFCTKDRVEIDDGGDYDD